jgi:hypothetical protein
MVLASNAYGFQRVTIIKGEKRWEGKRGRGFEYDLTILLFINRRSALSHQRVHNSVTTVLQSATIV